jgi:hypothetical protein
MELTNQNSGAMPSTSSFNIQIPASTAQGYVCTANPLKLSVSGDLAVLLQASKHQQHNYKKKRTASLDQLDANCGFCDFTSRSSPVPVEIRITVNSQQ